MTEDIIITAGVGKVAREQILFFYHKSSEAPHETNKQQISKLTQRRSWFQTVHDYSCATHCHKWLKATKKGTRKVPEGGPIMIYKIESQTQPLAWQVLQQWRQKTWVRTRVMLHQPFFSYSF